MMPIQIDILSCIPQRPPFVLVETLECCNENGATTRFTIPVDHVLVEANQLQESGLIENMAQTAAAQIGYLCQQQNKSVPIGFIGAVQDLQVQRLPEIGEVLDTVITIKNQIFNATIVEAQISIEGHSIARSELRIFVSEN